MPRLLIAYALLAVLVVAVAALIVIQVRRHRREHERIWGRRRNRNFD